MLKISWDNDIRTLAIPAIDSGVFKFPISLAVLINTQTLPQHSKSGSEFIRICTSNDETFRSYKHAGRQDASKKLYRHDNTKILFIQYLRFNVP